MARPDVIVTFGPDLAQARATGVMAGREMKKGLSSSLAGANSSLSSLNMGIDAKRFSQPLGKISGDLSQFQSSLQASTARVLAFGASASVMAGVVTGFKNIVSAAISVEKSLQDINVLLNMSESNLEKFSSGLFSVAKNTSQAFSEVASAANEFARQGLSAAETLKRTNDALILTRVSGMSAVEAVKTLTAAVNGFRSEAIDTSEVVNRLANVDANFAVSSSDLSQALARSASVAQSAKVSFNELIAVTTAVQQITARGGSVIGNSFKTIFTRIQRASVRNELEKIGVATADSNGNFRNAIEILKDYAAVYDSLSDQQQAYTSEQIAGVRQVNNLKALIKDLNSGYSIYNRSLAVANDTTDEAYIRNERLNETLDSLVKRTKATGTEFGKVFGEGALAPGIKSLLTGINSLGESLNNLFGEDSGNSITKGFLKGLGNILSGPGLAVLGKAIFKLFQLLSADVGKAFKQILDLNKGFANVQKTTDAITSALRNQPEIYNKLLLSTGDRVKSENLIINALKKEVALYNQSLAINKAISRAAISKAISYSNNGNMSVRASSSTAPVGGFASGGPKFTRGLATAVKKEHVEGGVSYSKIRAHFNKNGDPIAVTNSRDEPRGLRDIKYKVPNFAKSSPVVSSYEAALARIPNKPLRSSSEISATGTSSLLEELNRKIKQTSDAETKRLFSSKKIMSEQEASWRMASSSFRKMERALAGLTATLQGRKIDPIKASQEEKARVAAVKAVQKDNRKKIADKNRAEKRFKGSGRGGFVTTSETRKNLATMQDETYTETKYTRLPKFDKNSRNITKLQWKEQSHRERVAKRNATKSERLINAKRDRTTPKGITSAEKELRKEAARQRASDIKRGVYNRNVEASKNLEAGIKSGKIKRPKVLNINGRDVTPLSRMQKLRGSLGMNPRGKMFSRPRFEKGGGGGIGMYFAAQSLAGMLEESKAGQGNKGSAITGGMSKALQMGATASMFGASGMQSVGIGATIGITQAILDIADVSDISRKALDDFNSATKETSDAASGAISTAELLNQAYEEADPVKIKKLSDQFSNLTDGINDEGLKDIFSTFSGDIKMLEKELNNFSNGAEKARKALELNVARDQTQGISGLAYNLSNRIKNPIESIFNPNAVAKREISAQKDYRKKLVANSVGSYAKSLGNDKKIDQADLNKAKNDVMAFRSVEQSSYDLSVSGSKDSDIKARKAAKDALKSAGIEDADLFKRISESSAEQISQIMRTLGDEVEKEVRSSGMQATANAIRKQKAEISKAMSYANEQSRKAMENTFKAYSSSVFDATIGRKYRQATYDPYEDFFNNREVNRGRLTEGQLADENLAKKERDIVSELKGSKVDLASKIIKDQLGDYSGGYSSKDDIISNSSVADKNFINSLIEAVETGSDISSVMADKDSLLYEKQDDLKNAIEEMASKENRDANLQIQELRAQTNLLKLRNSEEVAIKTRSANFFPDGKEFLDSRQNISNAFKSLNSALLNSVKGLFSLTGSKTNIYSAALKGGVETRTSLTNNNALLRSAGLANPSRYMSYNVNSDVGAGDNTAQMLTRRRTPYEYAKSQFGIAEGFLNRNKNELESARKRVASGMGSSKDYSLVYRGSMAYEAKESSILAGQDARLSQMRPEERGRQKKVFSLSNVYRGLDDKGKEEFKQTFRDIAGNKRATIRDAGDLSTSQIEKILGKTGAKGPVVQAISEIGEDVSNAMIAALKGQNFEQIGKDLEAAINIPSAKLIELQKQLKSIQDKGLEATVHLAVTINNGEVIKTDVTNRSEEGAA